MLKGKDFGAAIDAAIKLKLATGAAPSKAAIARFFGMQPPSLADWVKKGSVSKEKIPAMWAYFSDVVGPEHWGLSAAEWPAGLSLPKLQATAEADTKWAQETKLRDVKAAQSTAGDGRGAPHPETDVIEIRQFDTGGSMGRGLELKDQPGVIQGWRVTPEWINKNVRGFSSTKNLSIVTGFGDSMRPMYNPGDPLIVDTGIADVKFDGVYFFRVGNEGFIKRLQRIPGQGLMAISENKAYRDWIIDPGMDFEVFGRVLKVWRSEEF